MLRITDYVVTDHALRITDHRLPITHYRSRITKYVTHERQNCFRCWFRLRQTFLQAKTFTKKCLRYQPQKQSART